jgi:hypothetical protein
VKWGKAVGNTEYIGTFKKGMGYGMDQWMDGVKRRVLLQIVENLGRSVRCPQQLPLPITERERAMRQNTSFSNKMSSASVFLFQTTTVGKGHHHHPSMGVFLY